MHQSFSAITIKVVKISAKRPAFSQTLRELWEHRGLLYTFARRDYKARYAQTFAGMAWALLQPLLALAVLYLLFQRVLMVETQGISFFPYALSGLLFWNYFQFVVSQSAAALIDGQRMLQKIYFPRSVLPLSKGILALVEAGVLFLLFLFFLGSEPIQPWALLAWPLCILGAMLAALGLGLWFSALSIRFRDLQQIIPILLQFLFFLTPVAYAPEMLLNLLPKDLYWLIYLNPLTGIIETFRHLLWHLPWQPEALLSWSIALMLTLSGAWYFQRVERKIADWI